MSEEDDEVPFTARDRRDIQEIKTEQAVHSEKLGSMEQHLRTVTTNISEKVGRHESKIENHETRISDTEAEALSAKRISQIVGFGITSLIAVVGLLAAMGVLP